MINDFMIKCRFCADKHIILNNLVMEIYSRFHGSEKKVSTA